MNCTLLEILDKVPEWSADEMRENLDHVLPLLQSALNLKEEKVLSLRAVQTLLKNCLPYAPITDIESKILGHALPATKSLFREGLQAIVIQLTDNLNVCIEEVSENLTSLLQVCIELLNCLDISLGYIASLGKVPASDLCSIPGTVMSVLYDAFKHFKDSKTLYNKYFQPLGEDLATMFRMSSKVQTSIIAVMTDNLQFNCAYEEDLEMLKDSVELLARIGEQLVGLDVKTMAELWKAHSQLTRQYAVELRPRLDVATPIKFLAHDICCSLKTFSEVIEIENNTISRSLKIGGFNLKLIIKLCESYAGYLGDCHRELCTLLISLHSYSQVYLQTKQIPRNILEDVERHLTIGADPLLSSLVGDVQFVQRYFELDTTNLQKENKRLGCLLLSASVLKKLLQCDPTIRSMWQNSNRNILSLALKLLDDCHSEMCWKLSIPVIVTGGEMPRNAELYEIILIHAAAFAVTSPADEFASVERLLLDSVLQPNVWRALLATDVWCIIARYGSSELCLEQMLALIKILQCGPMASDVACPEKCYFNALISRLFLLLSDRSKAELVTLFPPTENQLLWEILQVQHVPEKLKTSVVEISIANANSSISDFLCLSASLDRYNLMFASLSGIISLQIDSLDNMPCEGVRELTNNILTLWLRTTLPELLSSEETSQRGSQWLSCLLSKLTAATCCLIAYMNNSQILQVAEIMKSVIRHSSSTLKISVVLFLKCLATKFIEPTPSQSTVCQQIASLFTTLLQDANPLVRQVTLEVFAYFAYVTRHEQIVPLAVSNSKELQRKIKAYLQKVTVEQSPAEKRHLMTLDEYLKCQSVVKFRHKCADRKLSRYPCPELDAKSVSEVTESTETAENKILEVLRRMQSDVGSLFTLCEDTPLSQTLKDQVLSIDMQLRNIINS